MQIKTIKAGNRTLACAKAFNRIWQRFYDEELLVSSEKGELQLSIAPESPKSSIEVLADGTVKITAPDEKELFKSSMIFLQEDVSDKLQIGKTEIATSTQEKLLMVDIGRKYFSLAALKELVDLLALFNFDQLQLHFSENEGFRIESEQYPWLASKEHLSKGEVRELIQYAHAKYIEIIPDLDTPGHLMHALADKPEWRLDKRMADGSIQKDPKALDILNPEAVAFIHSLYREYGELFCDCRYFHIGADEFVPFDQLHDYPTLEKYAAEKYGSAASGIEVFIEYVNETIEYVRQLGFVPLVWNDGFYRVNRTEGLHLSKDCVVSYWTRWDRNMAPVETFLEQGYTVINHNDNYFYYVLGEHASYDYPTYEKIMADWHPVNFPQKQVIQPQQLKQSAANAIAIWSNVAAAKSEKEVNEDIFYIAAALMQKADERTLGDKETITKLYDKFFN